MLSKEILDKYAYYILSITVFARNSGKTDGVLEYLVKRAKENKNETK